MKILVFAPRDPWPPTTGGRLRDYHLARELAQRASVTFVGLYAEGDAEPAKPPESDGFDRVVLAAKGPSYTPWKVFRGLIGPRPVTMLNFESGNARQILEDVLRDAGPFDSVQIEGVQLGGYLPLVRRSQPDAALVSDWHNIESEIMWRYAERNAGLRKLAALRTAPLLERAERRLLAACDICTLASERERDQAAAKWGYGQKLAVIGNGVETGRFTEAAMEAARSQAPPEVQAGTRSILFVGSMDYHANIDAVQWFAREIWPEIRQSRKDVQFVVVGRQPGPEIRALEGNGIRITGTVADVRPYYAHAALVVVPLRVGSGTRLKILEAMAAGVPVVSTRLGAEGLDLEGGCDLLLADRATEIRNAVQDLLGNPDKSKRLAARGRDTARLRYDWGNLGAKLYELHREAAARVRRRRG